MKPATLDVDELLDELDLLDDEHVHLICSICAGVKLGDMPKPGSVVPTICGTRMLWLPGRGLPMCPKCTKLAARGYCPKCYRIAL